MPSMSMKIFVAKVNGYIGKGVSPSEAHADAVRLFQQSARTSDVAKREMIALARADKNAFRRGRKSS